MWSGGSRRGLVSPWEDCAADGGRASGDGGVSRAPDVRHLRVRVRVKGECEG